VGCDVPPDGTVLGAAPTLDEGMLRLRVFLSALLACAALLSPPADAEAPKPSRRVSTPEDLAAIRDVLDRFMAAVENKNGKELSALVLHSRILFTSPRDQTGVDAVRAYDANFDGVGAGGFGDFARFVSTTKDAIEERFTNVEMVQDGPVAWVFFDYEFLENGKVENYGVEVWQLRKTDGKWKIFSVVWTSHAPAR